MIRVTPPQIIRTDPESAPAWPIRGEGVSPVVWMGVAENFLDEIV